jgi:hypothetical protein
MLPLLATLRRDHTSYFAHTNSDVLGIVNALVRADPAREPRTRIGQLLYWLQRGIAACPLEVLALALVSAFIGAACALSSTCAEFVWLFTTVLLHIVVEWLKAVMRLLFEFLHPFICLAVWITRLLLRKH